MHGQVEELATRYGKLDIMWFDFSYEEMMGEKWRATELIRMLRSHQPHVITDNRLEASGEGFGSIATGKPTEYSGDFVSPEQIIPPQGLTDALGRPIPWECCLTMNNNWGYCQFDDNFKSPRVLIRKLVECVSKGGNMLLNVGPDARGNIPPRSLEIMAEIGRWLRANGDSIYGAGPADYPKPDYGRLTAKGDKLYLHVMEETIGPVPFSFISKERIARVRLLSTGAELPIADEWTTRNYPEYSFIALGKTDANLCPARRQRYGDRTYPQTLIPKEPRRYRGSFPFRNRLTGQIPPAYNQAFSTCSRAASRRPSAAAQATLARSGSRKGSVPASQACASAAPRAKPAG